MLLAFTIKAWFFSPSEEVGSSQDKGQSEIVSRVNKIQYFVLENFMPQLRLNADLLVNDEVRENISMEKIDGLAFTKEGDPLDYKANKGEVIMQENFLKLEGEVEMRSRKGHFLSSNTASYDYKNEVFYGEGDVFTKNISQKTRDTLEVNSDRVISEMAKEKSNFIGNVSGVIKRARDYESPVYFWADQINADLNKSYIELKKDVKLKRDNVTSTSLRGEIFMENYNKELKYYALYDDIVLLEKFLKPRGGVMERKAFGEKLDGLVSESKIILTGSPTVIQGEEVIRGNSITLFENNETVVVEDANSKFIIK